MNPDITIPEKLLLAALDLTERSRSFSAEDLVVQAWKMFPDSFGLAGYADQFPDSNRILTNIMGTKGVRGKGWLRKVGEKQYAVTSKGLADGAALKSRESYGSGGSHLEALRAELDRRTTGDLQRLISTNAARRALGQLSGNLSFNDACGFWDITVRSNANTLNTRLSEVTDLLSRTRELLLEQETDRLIKLPNATLSLEDVETLIRIHGDMQEMFKAELNVIRKRTDERLEKRLRLHNG